MDLLRPPRKLGLFSIVALGVNTIIGSGIFRVPAELKTTLGGLSPLAFVVGAIALLPVTLCFASLGARFREGGGVYRYAREAFGPSAGFLVGWSAWVATILTLAGVAVALAEHLASFASEPFGSAATKGIAVALLVTLFVINGLGLRAGAWASNALMITKVLSLLGFVALGAAFALHHLPSHDLVVSTAPSATSLGASLLVVFFVMSGFETSAVPASDTMDPEKNIPRAMVLALIGTALLYAMVQSVVVIATNQASTQPPLSAAAGTMLSELLSGTSSNNYWASIGSGTLSLVAAVSMTGLLASMVFAGPLFLDVLAADGFLPLKLARHQGSAPLAAAVATAIPTLLAATFLNFKNLVDFTSVVLSLQYIATCIAAVVVARRERRGAWGLYTLATLGTSVMLWVLSSCRWQDLVGTVLVLLIGAMMALLYRRAR